MTVTAANLVGLVSPKWETADLDEAITVASADSSLDGHLGSDRDQRTVWLAALYLLRRERAKILTAPTQWSAAGDYSESNTERLKALDRQIGEFEALTSTGAAGSGVTAGLSTVGRSKIGRAQRPGTNGTRS